MSNDIIWESAENHPYLEFRKVYEVFGEAPVAYYRVKGTVKEIDSKAINNVYL